MEKISENDINRYIRAQQEDYETALKEIKAGYKKSHWMWFMFPQIIGLGQSRTSIFYSIKNKDEAVEYMNNEILGSRMNEVCDALLSLEENDATVIFGTPDDMKLRSSMTLFAECCPENERFQKVLDKYFDGEKDPRTIEIIAWRSYEGK